MKLNQRWKYIHVSWFKNISNVMTSFLIYFNVSHPFLKVSKEKIPPTLSKCQFN